MTSILSECFSLLESWSFQTRNPQITHAQLYGTMCGISESIHQVRAPPAQWAELEAPVKNAVRPTKRGAWIGRNYSCISRRSCCKTNMLGHTGLGFKKEMFCTRLLTISVLGLPGWIRARYRGVGDIRPACLFPLVKSKCFLDSAVRRCCKVGHSCMRRVIGCSSVPHKMAWRSGARALRSVALVDQGATILTFDSRDLNSTVCFKNWTRRLRGVVGDAVVPCPALV